MAERRKFSVEIDVDLIDWYKETFPTSSLWFAINELLRHFKEQYESNQPPNYYLLGARALKEKLDRELGGLEGVE